MLKQKKEPRKGIHENSGCPGDSFKRRRRKRRRRKGKLKKERGRVRKDTDREREGGGIEVETEGGVVVLIVRSWRSRESSNKK